MIARPRGSTHRLTTSGGTWLPMVAWWVPPTRVPRRPARGARVPKEGLTSVFLAQVSPSLFLERSVKH